jgi:hypothetical protein
MYDLKKNKSSIIGALFLGMAGVLASHAGCLAVCDDEAFSRQAASESSIRINALEKLKVGPQDFIVELGQIYWNSETLKLEQTMQDNLSNKYVYLTESTTESDNAVRTIQHRLDINGYALISNGYEIALTSVEIQEKNGCLPIVSSQETADGMRTTTIRNDSCFEEDTSTERYLKSDSYMSRFAIFSIKEHRARIAENIQH